MLTFHVLELEGPTASESTLPRFVVLERDSDTLQSQELACCYTRERAIRVRAALEAAQNPTVTVTRNLCPACAEYKRKHLEGSPESETLTDHFARVRCDPQIT